MRGRDARDFIQDQNFTFLAIIVGLLNVFLLLILLGIYLSSYRKIKSSFTLGLVAFTVLLILQNTIFIMFMVTREGFKGHGIGFPVLSVNICQFAALTVLLRMAWE